MADKINEVGKVPYNSPGIYFRTFDLTTVTNQIGEYRGAQVGLMERGPAFEIMISNTYTQRAYRFGDLNPEFKTSYYAKQYLEQAEGLKEVRVLGLEGYNDTIGYAIMSGVGIEIPHKDEWDGQGIGNISQVNNASSKILAILKQRKSSFTGLPPIHAVMLSEATSPTTGFMAATDELFKLTIEFAPNSNKEDMVILCSLRESSKDFILKKLGNNPLSHNKIGSDICPLWVDYVDATSEELRYDYATNKFRTRSYYQNVLPTQAIKLVTGNIEFTTATPINNITDVRLDLSGPNVKLVVLNYDATEYEGLGVEFQNIEGLTTENIEVINGQHYFIADGVFENGDTVFNLYNIDTGELLLVSDFGEFVDFVGADSFAIYNKDKDIIAELDSVSNQDPNNDLTFLATLAGDRTNDFEVGDKVSFHLLSLWNSNGEDMAGDLIDLEIKSVTYQSSTVIEFQKIGETDTYETPSAIIGVDSFNPNINIFLLPTWEKEALDFENQEYLTPSTPWFVSEIDSNGDFKRLFRLWSISDGKLANTEMKVDISDINPQANGGKGFFNLTLRVFSNRDDSERVRVETFSNLTLDKTSDNYILKRIGDGENYQLRSQFVFIEMNEDEELENDLLPMGTLGYPNISGGRMNDVPWTVDYDKTKSIARQTLGIANNTVNMNRKLNGDMLSFRKTESYGKGFHLNLPSRDTGKSLNLNAAGHVVSSDLSSSALETLNSQFIFASKMIHNDVNGKIVSQQERVKRNKFTVAFYGGFDGWNVYSERQWNDPNSKDFEAFTRAINLLQDSELLDTDFTVLVTPDINMRDHSNACSIASEMVYRRDDALYIPDFAYDATADVNEVANLIEGSNFKSGHISVYHPWLQINDSLNKVNPWVPASLLAWGTIANLGNQGQVWSPPGGNIKTVTNNLIRTRKRLDLPEREILFNYNINPISKFNAGEYEIVGVKTTQEHLSALSYVHNKLLLCYAKKALRQTLRALLFIMSNEEASDQFILRVTPIFERIKRLNGIAEFKVSTRNELALNDKTTIYGVIEIVPLYPVERIVVDFVLKDGELNFDQ